MTLAGVVLGSIAVTALTVRLAIGSGERSADETGGQIDRTAAESGLANRDLRDFDGIEVDGTWTVEVRQGNEWQVDLSLPETDREGIGVSVHNGKLRLSGESGGSWFGASGAKLAADIVMPRLEALATAGNNEITLSGFEGSALTIEVAGANQITGEQGRYETLALSVAGANRVDLAGFVFTDADVELAGATDVALTMDGGELTGGLVGAGSIEYFGTVSREAVDIAGFGSVTAATQ